MVPGAKRIYSSADEPGLIYDVLAVSPDSLAQNKGEWLKVLKVWYQAVDFLKDPATREEAISIMAARVGIPAEEYKGFIDGTKILTLEEALPFMEKSEGFKSLYGSSKIADVFNVANEVYADEQPVDSYIDASLMKAL
jgi:NitT/TauT family transport system substrate-binding protein